MHGRLMRLAYDVGAFDGDGPPVSLKAQFPQVQFEPNVWLTGPPPGRFGGRSGESGFNRVRRRDGTIEELAAKQVNISLQTGDRFLLGTSGGGGLGEPALRRPDLVVDDVRQGRVSAESAALDYGQPGEAT